MNNFYIGVDIGGTSIKLAIISENGEITKKWEIETNIENNGESIPTDIYQTIKKQLDAQNLTFERVLGIGVGAPGFVDVETGLVYQAVNIGWNNFELSEAIKTLTNVPVFVENDANLAALGENWLGAGEQSDNLLAVTLGTGVGGGIIANGKMINGSNGTAGEIGHITVKPENGAPCNCGKTGCIETIASATGIVRLAKEGIEAGKETILEDKLKREGKLTSKDVFDAAVKRDAFANDLISYVTDSLGLVIANLANTLNPEKIVIGGGVSKAGTQLLVPLEKAFKKYALPRTQKAVEFVIAKLGNDAGVIGGAYLVKEKLNK